MASSSSPTERSLRRILHLSTLAGAALAVACSDRGPALPDEPAAPPPEGSTARLECRATVASGEVRCSETAGGGPRGNLMLGGQGERVRLASTGTRYDGDSIFQSSVSVQNLLGQEMGTPDGTDIYGVNVFFVSGPVVVDGTGTVQVANADGEGTFTATGQPYFHYHEILAPGGTSQPAPWRFRVPPTVHQFAFTLLVDTRLRAEDGVLRWSRVQGSPTDRFSQLRDVWGSSPENVWAVGRVGVIRAGEGRVGVILRWQGRGWSWVSNPAGEDLNAVWGTDPYSVVAVGNEGTILRYDGNRWTAVQGAASRLNDVWAATRESYFAVGTGGFGWIVLHSPDGGTTWERLPGIPDPGPEPTSFLSVAPPTTDLFAVWGTSPLDVFAVGYRIDDPDQSNAHGVILHTDDGGASWSELGFPDLYQVSGIWGSAPEDMYAVGAAGDEGVVLHSADHGATWTSVRMGSPDMHWFFTSVWGRSADDVYIFGSQTSDYRDYAGIVLHSTDRGASWNLVPDAAPSVAFNAWAAPAGDIFLAAGAIRRFDGAAWSDGTAWIGDDALSTNTLWQGVWSPGPDRVVVVGETPGGSYKDVVVIGTSSDGGATWAVNSIEGVPSGRLYAVAATSPTTLFAVGTQSAAPLLVRSLDGGESWTQLVLPATGIAPVPSAMWASPDGVLYVAGTELDAQTRSARPFIFRSADSGNSWTPAAIAPSVGERSLLGIGGCPSGALYAVGADSSASGKQGLILHSLDGGLTWSQTLTGPQASTGLAGVACTPAGIYAVGDRLDPVTHRRWGVVLRSADGTAWETDHTETNVAGVGYTAAWAAENGDLYVTGTMGALLHRSATGWVAMETGTQGVLTAISGSSPRSAWAVGNFGTVLRGLR